MWVMPQDHIHHTVVSKNNNKKRGIINHQYPATKHSIHHATSSSKLCCYFAVVVVVVKSLWCQPVPRFYFPFTSLSTDLCSFCFTSFFFVPWIIYKLTKNQCRGFLLLLYVVCCVITSFFYFCNHFIFGGFVRHTNMRESKINHYQKNK